MEQEKVKFYERSLKYRIKKNLKRFRLYCYTAIVSAVLMFILLFIFTSILHIHYLISLIITYAITVTNSFILDKILVFKSFNPKPIKKQYYYYFLVSFSAFLANLISLYVLVEFLNLWYLSAEFLIALIGLPLLFLVHKYLIFSYR